MESLPSLFLQLLFPTEKREAYLRWNEWVPLNANTPPAINCYKLLRPLPANFCKLSSQPENAFKQRKVGTKFKRMKANGASKFRNINQLKENSEYFESFQPRVEKVSADSSPLMFFRGNVAAVHCFIHLVLSLPPALLNSITSQLSCVLSLGRLQSLTIFACHCDHRIRFSSSSRLNRHLFWSLKSAQKFET